MILSCIGLTPLGSIMLNIQIDNSDIENDIKQVYGENSQDVVVAFAEFLQAKRIAEDVRVSIEEFDQGKGIPSASVFASIKAKYQD